MRVVRAIYRNLRRSTHDHGVEIFLVLLVAAILALVAGLMYVLTNPTWRPRL